MRKLKKPSIVKALTEENLKENITQYTIRFSDSETYTFIKQKDKFSKVYNYTILFKENGIIHKLFEIEKEEGGIPTAYLKPIAEVDNAPRKIKEMFFLVESYEHPEWTCVATLDREESKIFKGNNGNWFTKIYKNEKYTLVVEERHDAVINNKEISESTKVLYINKHVKNSNRRGQWKNAPVDLCIFTNDPNKDGKGWKDSISKTNSKMLFEAENVIRIEYKISEISQEEFLKRYAPMDYIRPEIRLKPEWRRPLPKKSKFLKWFETLSPEAQAKLEAIWDKKEEERLEQERFGLNGLPIEVISKKKL